MNTAIQQIGKGIADGCAIVFLFTAAWTMMRVMVFVLAMLEKQGKGGDGPWDGLE